MPKWHGRKRHVRKVIDTEKLPIKLWLDDIEDGALQQAKNLANLPFAFKWISIMPDSHEGYGMPIGGVMATRGVVVPNAVGVDIGCGMCAVPTSLRSCDVETLKIIMEKIRESVPVGFNHLKEKQSGKVSTKPRKFRLFSRSLRNPGQRRFVFSDGNARGERLFQRHEFRAFICERKQIQDD